MNNWWIGVTDNPNQIVENYVDSMWLDNLNDDRTVSYDAKDQLPPIWFENSNNLSGNVLMNYFWNFDNMSLDISGTIYKALLPSLFWITAGTSSGIDTEFAKANHYESITGRDISSSQSGGNFNIFEYKVSVPNTQLSNNNADEGEIPIIMVTIEPMTINYDQSNTTLISDITQGGQINMYNENQTNLTNLLLIIPTYGQLGITGLTDNKESDDKINNIWESTIINTNGNEIGAMAMYLNEENYGFFGNNIPTYVSYPIYISPNFSDTTNNKTRYLYVVSVQGDWIDSENYNYQDASSFVDYVNNDDIKGQKGEKLEYSVTVYEIQPNITEGYYNWYLAPYGFNSTARSYYNGKTVMPNREPVLYMYFLLGEYEDTSTSTYPRITIAEETIVSVDLNKMNPFFNYNDGEQEFSGVAGPGFTDKVIELPSSSDTNFQWIGFTDNITMLNPCINSNQKSFASVNARGLITDRDFSEIDQKIPGAAGQYAGLW